MRYAGVLYHTTQRNASVFLHLFVIFLWSLFEQTAQYLRTFRPGRATAGRAVEIDQYRLLTDDLDILPLYDDVRRPAQSAEQTAVAADDQRRDLGGAGVHLHIVHKAQTGAVADVDDLFIVHVRNARNHSPLPFHRIVCNY